MKEIYSNVESNKLLHIINRFDEIQGRKDLVSEKEFLQVSTHKWEEGKKFKPHRHIWKDIDYVQAIAQESWVVIKGSVKIDYYDIDDSFICSEIINQGDTSITLFGGHGYEILEEDTVVYEYKTGPYFGQKLDKVFLEK